MIKDEELNKLQTEHKVILESRSSAFITGVKDVDSFNENEIIFITVAGAITLTGSELHISKLNLEEGILGVSGTIQSVDYADHEEKRSRGFISRVFR